MLTKDASVRVIWFSLCVLWLCSFYTAVLLQDVEYLVISQWRSLKVKVNLFIYFFYWLIYSEHTLLQSCPFTRYGTRSCPSFNNNKQKASGTKWREITQVHFLVLRCTVDSITCELLLLTQISNLMVTDIAGIVSLRTEDAVAFNHSQSFPLRHLN